MHFDIFNRGGLLPGNIQAIRKGNTQISQGNTVSNRIKVTNLKGSWNRVTTKGIWVEELPSVTGGLASETTMSSWQADFYASPFITLYKMLLAFPSKKWNWSVSWSAHNPIFSLLKQGDGGLLIIVKFEHVFALFNIESWKMAYNACFLQQKHWCRFM